MRIRVLCILDQCLAFQKLGPGQSLEPAVERWEPIPAEADEAVVVKRLTCRFLHSVDVNAVVIEWGLSEGTWHIIRMNRPAPAWKTPTGDPISPLHLQSGTGGPPLGPLGISCKYWVNRLGWHGESVYNGSGSPMRPLDETIIILKCPR